MFYRIQRYFKYFKKVQWLSRTVLFLFTIALAACATYQTNVSGARSHLHNHEPEQAISILEPLAKKEGNDQLVYIFDLASALQVAGRYDESNKYFHEADKMSDLKNYVSISRQGLSLLLSEEYTQYKGEDFERLLINFFSALNYLMLHDRENALVEVRRLNEKLEYYRLEEKKEYEQNTAALYVSALLWEADKNWDSAYIDYERAFKRDPHIPMLKYDLIRAAQRAGRDEQLSKWTRQFGLKAKPEWSDKSLGEVVLIYQQGWGPRKAERERIMTSVGFISPGLPRLVPVPSITKRARLEIYDGVVPAPLAAANPVIAQSESEVIYSVQDTAIKTLEDAYAPLIAKRIAAYIAKDAAAKAVGGKNDGVTAILSIAMHAADRADLRQWSMLPQTIQVARIMVKPGRYTINVRGLTDFNSDSGENRPSQEIEVRPGQKTFINWRSFK